MTHKKEDIGERNLRCMYIWKNSNNKEQPVVKINGFKYRMLQPRPPLVYAALRCDWHCFLTP